MKKRKVIAILTADWHLSHKPPVWRSNEPDWYEAMARPIHEIHDLSLDYDCPILVAGDVFDKWYGAVGKGDCAELLNWALRILPDNLWGIPGQHDIPNHNMKELPKSAYGLLVRAKKIKQISHINLTKYYGGREATITYCKYKEPLSFKEGRETDLAIALVHDYVCIKGADYPKAPKEAYIKPRGFKSKNYAGYDVVVYGDNHKGFRTHLGKTVIFNCGTLLRRKSDEENYKPMVGLLYSDGSVEPHYLDISKDKHLTAEEAKPLEENQEIDMTEFANELRKLGTTALDFADAVKRYCSGKKIERPIRDIIDKAMER